MLTQRQLRVLVGCSDVFPCVFWIHPAELTEVGTGEESLAYSFTLHSRPAVRKSHSPFQLQIFGPCVVIFSYPKIIFTVNNSWSELKFPFKKGEKEFSYLSLKEYNI